jgi:hypothetical protein
MIAFLNPIAFTNRPAGMDIRRRPEEVQLHIHRPGVAERKDALQVGDEDVVQRRHPAPHEEQGGQH